MDEFLAIFRSDAAEIDKLAQGFDWMTRRMVEQAENEIELLRALEDRESLVKEQIKMGVLKHARGIFEDCYVRATGRRAWDE